MEGERVSSGELRIYTTYIPLDQLLNFMHSYGVYALSYFYFIYTISICYEFLSAVCATLEIIPRTATFR